MNYRVLLAGSCGRPRRAAGPALNLGLFVLCSILTVILLSGYASAGAPKVGTQAPAFYRMTLGNFEITALSDGTHPFPVHKVLTKTS